ncbi:MAG: glycosyltransferase [Coriobacteriia bacterium]|nr:glycosyltransferase [Coriobacteriia bacterium]
MQLTVPVPERLNDVAFHVVLHDVWHHRGGLVRNALHKASLIGEALDRDVTILTLAFTLDQDDSGHRLRQMGVLGPRVQVINLFDEAGISGDAPRGLFAEDVHRPARPGAIKPDTGPSSEWDAVETHDPDGRSIVTYRDAGGRVLREERRDLAGRLRKSVTLDAVTGEPLRRLYFDDEGRPRVEFGHGTEPGAPWQIRFADEHGAFTHVFDSERSMRTEWLDHHAALYDESIFQVETESPLITSAVLQMTNPSAAKVTMLHASHLDAPHTYGSPTMPEHAPMLARLDRFDAFVLITEEQRADVAEEFGPRATLHAVPHDAPTSRDALSPDKDRWLGVGIGRFAERKNWSDVVRAFRSVSETHPEARFELWGLGPLRWELQRLIDGLGLTDVFRVMGTTADSASVFSRASYSVLAGIREGMPLVIAESMAQGTPTVAYDGKYGITELIRDGVDGTVVTYGDVEALAEAMSSMLDDPDRTRSMGERALEVDRRFSAGLCVERWFEVYVAAMEQKDRRVALPRMTARASHVFAQGERYRIEASIRLGEFAETPDVRLYARPRATIVGARYVEAQSVSRQGGHLQVIVDFDPDDVLRSGVVWDVYASVSLRNAHRFVRIAAGREAFGVFNTGGVAPTVTRGGNLSFVPARGPQTARQILGRARRRLRGLLRPRAEAR